MKRKTYGALPVMLVGLGLAVGLALELTTGLALADESEEPMIQKYEVTAEHSDEDESLRDDVLEMTYETTTEESMVEAPSRIPSSVLALPVDDGSSSVSHEQNPDSDADAELETQASSDLIARSVSGTCTWALDSDGILTIRPTSGSDGTLGDWTDGGYPPWFKYRMLIRAVHFMGRVHCTTCIRMFCECSSLMSLNLSQLDTSKVACMSKMLYGCSSLKSVNLSYLDTSRVTDMYCMFHGCSSLKSLNLSYLDTSRVTDMGYMFHECSSLESLDLSHFKTSRVAYMNNMFYGCSSLRSLDLAGFDLSSAENLATMFTGCDSLQSCSVGSKYSVEPMSPFPMAISANGKWWSTKTGVWFTRQQIMTDRKGITDTYTYKGNLSKAKVAQIPTERYTGAAVKPTPKVTMGGTTLVEGTDYTLSFKNNVAIGTATITLTGKGDYEGTAKVSFRIARTNLSTAAIARTASKVYTGKAIKPTPKVTMGGTTLVVNRDYTLSYRNNKTAGTATIVVTGKGSYEGTAKTTFRITRASISKAKVSKMAAQVERPNGKPLKPSPKVTLGGTTLKEGVDYSLSYKNSTTAGTAIVTVTGKGNYAGSVSAKFTVKPNVQLCSILWIQPRRSAKSATIKKIIYRKDTPKERVLVKGRDYKVSFASGEDHMVATVSGIGEYGGTATYMIPYAS